MFIIFTKKPNNSVCFYSESLDVFNARKDILESVYRSLIESILVFNIVTWYGNQTVTLKPSKVGSSRQPGG